MKNCSYNSKDILNLNKNICKNSEATLNKVINKYNKISINGHSKDIFNNNTETSKKTTMTKNLFCNNLVINSNNKESNKNIVNFNKQDNILNLNIVKNSNKESILDCEEKDFDIQNNNINKNSLKSVKICQNINENLEDNKPNVGNKIDFDKNINILINSNTTNQYKDEVKQSSKKKNLSKKLNKLLNKSVDKKYTKSFVSNKETICLDYKSKKKTKENDINYIWSKDEPKKSLEINKFAINSKYIDIKYKKIKSYLNKNDSEINNRYNNQNIKSNIADTATISKLQLMKLKFNK